jgi:hypothetical protein
MKKIILTFITLGFVLGFNAKAQNDTVPSVAYATGQYRNKEYIAIVNRINRILSLSLNTSTEEDWQDAFNAIELIQYKTAWINGKIRLAVASVENRTVEFQRSLVDLLYSNYSKDFIAQVAALSQKTNDAKLFAMCAEYIFANNKKEFYRNALLKKIKNIEPKTDSVNKVLFLEIIKNKLNHNNPKRPAIADLLNESFLKNEIITFSFQRKNRNYPGLVMVRGKDGNFVKDDKGIYFSVPQLARSLSNMPGYLSNGNTPQGIFKMIGFGNSKSTFIGPTTNIQMVMPFEKSEDVPDSVTQYFGSNYKNLLPDSWKNYFQFFEAYYAGLAGRTEIIAHGTTVNPDYYKTQPYYPLTPTAGCLCTKELWDTIDGKRKESDQQKLVNTLKLVGGANGYCVVIEIDDLQKPVSIGDVLPYLKKQ